MSPSFVINALFVLAVICMLAAILSVGLRPGDGGRVSCALGRHQWYTWANGDHRQCRRPHCTAHQVRRFHVTRRGVGERWIEEFPRRSRFWR
jgi:hypothetical protein